MKNLQQHFDKLYYPVSALVFYQTKDRFSETYVEHYEMDKHGIPRNAHPLTVREANRLATALKTSIDEKELWLSPKGIFSNQLLYLEPSTKKVVWYTKAMQRKLFFDKQLGIPCGSANVPPMLWIANQNELRVFALGSNRRPTEKSPLYNAPFFNVYEDGNVCMGTVELTIKKTDSLEEFMKKWESFFFNSYFSHLIMGFNPVKGNCVSLWENIVSTGCSFPKEVLTKANVTFKKILQ